MRVARPALFERSEFAGLAFLRLRRSFSEGALLLFWGDAKKEGSQKVSKLLKKIHGHLKFGMNSYFQKKKLVDIH